MTRIKYASVYRRESDDEPILLRGRQHEATIEMFTEPDDGESELWEARRIDVIELPRSMSPSEYREWAREHAEDVLAEHVVGSE